MTQVSKNFLEYFSEIYETKEDTFTLRISEIFKVNGLVEVSETVTLYELKRNLPISFKEEYLKLSKIPILNFNTRKVLDSVKGYTNIVTSLEIYNKFFKNTKLEILIDESYNDKILVYNKSKLIINDNKYYYDEENYKVIILK